MGLQRSEVVIARAAKSFRLSAFPLSPSWGIRKCHCYSKKEYLQSEDTVIPK